MTNTLSDARLKAMLVQYKAGAVVGPTDVAEIQALILEVQDRRVATVAALDPPAPVEFAHAVIAEKGA